MLSQLIKWEQTQPHYFSFKSIRCAPQSAAISTGRRHVCLVSKREETSAVFFALPPSSLSSLWVLQVALPRAGEQGSPAMGQRQWGTRLTGRHQLASCQSAQLMAQQTIIQSQSAGLTDLPLHLAGQVGQPGRPAYLTAIPMDVRCTVTSWST